MLLLPNGSTSAFADLLGLSSCDTKYRAPCVMRKFIEASGSVEKRQVDCCLNGCVAFPHKRSRLTSCDTCGTARYLASDKPARQMTYWPLTFWLIYMLIDPILGPNMKNGMKEARSAASRNSDGKHREVLHDWRSGVPFIEALPAALFHKSTDIAISVSTDGLTAWRSIGFFNNQQLESHCPRPTSSRPFTTLNQTTHVFRTSPTPSTHFRRALRRFAWYSCACASYHRKYHK